MCAYFVSWSGGEECEDDAANGEALDGAGRVLLEQESEHFGAPGAHARHRQRRQRVSVRVVVLRRLITKKI